VFWGSPSHVTTLYPQPSLDLYIHQPAARRSLHAMVRVHPVSKHAAATPSRPSTHVVNVVAVPSSSAGCKAGSLGKLSADSATTKSVFWWDTPIASRCCDE
jgi:hypothetical protein